VRAKCGSCKRENEGNERDLGFQHTSVFFSCCSLFSTQELVQFYRSSRRTSWRTPNAENGAWALESLTSGVTYCMDYHISSVGSMSGMIDGWGLFLNGMFCAWLLLYSGVGVGVWSQRCSRQYSERTECMVILHLPVVGPFWG
jgi:hypothetical protein